MKLKEDFTGSLKLEMSNARGKDIVITPDFFLKLNFFLNFFLLFRLQVWPGVKLTVEVKDDGLMVMFDTPNRVLNTDTLYDF